MLMLEFKPILHSHTGSIPLSGHYLDNHNSTTTQIVQDVCNHQAAERPQHKKQREIIHCAGYYKKQLGIYISKYNVIILY